MTQVVVSLAAVSTLIPSFVPALVSSLIPGLILGGLVPSGLVPSLVPLFPAWFPGLGTRLPPLMILYTDNNHVLLEFPLK